MLKIIELPNDDYDGDVFSDSSFTGLNRVIKIHENSTDVVELDHDYSYTGSASDKLYQNGIEIVKDNFVIDGKGHTIDGKGLARLFDVKAKNVVIKNLNFINGFESRGAGFDSAIIHFFAPGKVLNCQFSKCISKQYGTVYFENGGNIINSKFLDCTCGDYGGALYINGGIIDKCTFIKNRVVYEFLYGAAVYAKGNVLINNSIFQENEGVFDSAIYYDGYLTLKNSVFTDNKLIFDVSGKNNKLNVVGTEGSLLWAENIKPLSIFSEDLVVLNGTSNDVGANYFNHYPGLEYLIQNCENGVLKLQNDFTFNSLFDSDRLDGIIVDRNNFVIDGLGHTINGLNVARLFNILGNNVTLKNLNLINGFSSHSAGAVLFSKDGKIENCNVINNTARSYGGAVYISGNGSIINSVFKNNYGGLKGIVLINKDAVVENSIFDNNTVEDEGTVSVRGNIIANNSQFTNNRAKYGAGFSCNGAFVNGCSFINNSVKSCGGGIYAKMVNIDNSTFDNNSALIGGGIAISSSNAMSIINNTSLTNNVAVEGGAVISNSKLIVDNSNIENNSADYGGALQIHNAGKVINSNISNNTARITEDVFIKEDLE